MPDRIPKTLLYILWKCMHVCTHTHFNYQCQDRVKDLQLTQKAHVIRSHQSISFCLKSSFIPISVSILTSLAQFFLFFILFVQIASLKRMLKNDTKHKWMMPVQKSHCSSKCILNGKAVIDSLLLFVLENQQGHSCCAIIALSCSKA